MDTIDKIQVDEQEFTNLEAFVQDQALYLVDFDRAKRTGYYTVVVFKDETVQKAFVTGVSRKNSIRFVVANRLSRRFTLKRNEALAIYQP